MTTDGDQKLFCFGYGYSCAKLGSTLLNQGGWKVSGTSRTNQKCHSLKEHGVKAFLFDKSKPLIDPLYILNGVTHIVMSIPPDKEGDPAFLNHAADLKKIKTLKWVGYLSTTGVYGNRDGEWVDETTETNPTSIRGTRRLIAENQWRSLYEKEGLPVHFFRLAGIYGPGRSALDAVRAGTARRINKPGHAFSRIHVDDIVQILMASMAKPNPGSIYNLCDNQAAPSHEVICYACELLDIEPPPMIDFEDADMAPMAMSFYKDNKRVRNNKLKDELGVDLLHPDYFSGLDACLEAEQHNIALGHAAI